MVGGSYPPEVVGSEAGDVLEEDTFYCVSGKFSCARFIRYGCLIPYPWTNMSCILLPNWSQFQGMSSPRCDMEISVDLTYN